MNQEITISQSIVKFIENGFPTGLDITLAQKIIPLIKENQIVIDHSKTHYYNLLQASKSVKDDKIRKVIQDILKYWFESIFVEVESECESEEQLALNSNDKILFIPNKTPKQIKKIKIRNYGLDVYNESDFASPEIYHRLKHKVCKLVFENGVDYDIKQIFEPYIRCTKKIIIEDPYLPNRTALENFKIILSLFNGKKIIIKTHSLENYSYDKRENRKKNKVKLYEYFEKVISSDNRIAKPVYYGKASHFERYIYTDSVQIKLPGGLDFLDINGKVNGNADFVEVEVNKLQ